MNTGTAEWDHPVTPAQQPENKSPELSEVRIVAKPSASLSGPNPARVANKAMQSDSGMSAVNAAAKSMQSDAPACNTCGHITIRSGTCYKCLNCGNSMGCS